jgi:hypothetical protein
MDVNGQFFERGRGGALLPRVFRLNLNRTLNLLEIEIKKKIKSKIESEVAR